MKRHTRLGLGFSVARVTACATPLIFYDQNKLKTTDMDYYTDNRNPFPRILHRLDNYMFLDRFSSIQTAMVATWYFEGGHMEDFSERVESKFYLLFSVS